MARGQVCRHSGDVNNNNRQHLQDGDVGRPDTHTQTHTYTASSEQNDNIDNIDDSQELQPRRLRPSTGVCGQEASADNKDRTGV